ncbi:MAG: hypothetical protein QOI80_3106, partial [Solirubrobacteraceae bacterium]|nr:hypothetical protein [Solirubrobacteraceae bacterium]
SERDPKKKVEKPEVEDQAAALEDQAALEGFDWDQSDQSDDLTQAS